jgi:hypothetical protein
MFKRINWEYYNLDYVVKIKYDKDTKMIKLFFNLWWDKTISVDTEDFDMFMDYLIKDE